MRNRSDYRLELLNSERAEHGDDPWAEYEKRKAELVRLDLTPKEYEQRLAELAEELGL